MSLFFTVREQVDADCSAPGQVLLLGSLISTEVRFLPISTQRTLRKVNRVQDTELKKFNFIELIRDWDSVCKQ